MTAPPCNTPIEWSALVDYWARDLPSDVESAVEEHLMGCAFCTERSAQVAEITEAIRGQIPPVISPEHLEVLRQRGARILEAPISPGQRRDVVFPSDVDLLIFRLGSLDLAGVARADVTLRTPSTGHEIVTIGDAPLDRDGGAVLVACQQHYRVFPPDLAVRVRLVDASGDERTVEYEFVHRFE